MSKSTIWTVLKNKEMIKCADVANGISVFTKQRSQKIDVTADLDKRETVGK